MTIQVLALILLGLSLSMDTLAVSVATGICKVDIRLKHAAKVGFIFAFVQSAMPGIGWYAGTRFVHLIKLFDHWLAFALLALIGGKMIYESLHDVDVSDTGPDCDAVQACPREDPTGTRRLFILALATSIDALAAGISLAVDGTPVILALPIIGFITFFVAFAGMMLGRRLGVLFQRKASLAGGCVLILLGIKILIEHMNSL